MFSCSRVIDEILCGHITSSLLCRISSFPTRPAQSGGEGAPWTVDVGTELVDIGPLGANDFHREAPPLTC